MNARKKKLLLAGRIHNPSGWARWPGLGDLEPLIHKWISHQLSDDEFFNEYSREYACRLKTWGPWSKLYSALARAAGTDENGVAYANVAKCWQFPGRESRLQRSCSEEFPLEDLVRLLEPHGVFLLAPDSWVTRVPGARVQTVPFMNDSAPHFRLSRDQIAAAETWVQTL